MSRTRVGTFLGLAMIVALTPLPSLGSSADEGEAAHAEHCDHAAASAPDDPHAQHAGGASGEAAYAKKLTAYDTPDVTLLGQDGQEHALSALLDSEKPVMMNFIFTSCTTICPVMTSTFVEVERQLGADREQVQMVSISIDPEHDTPTRLAEYALARGAGEPWTFLTGDLASIRQTQVAFDAYRGNKMNHVPITFLRATSNEPWLRIDGFAAASDIMREYRGLTTE